MSKPKAYLTIHGHFYQPPRENPWLESIELQDSALPFHDWNARINAECYNPNSFSKIVDGNNKILNIINNYSLMSYNFGPTLMSWLEVYSPLTYERIIKADVESIHDFSGHGNAIAQVYNHMIMPLANIRDKYTQAIWGIEDFKYRFGRLPEGIWLAETAVDDETLEVLVDCGIKFTILSPYQAEKVRPLQGSTKTWTDVSWGNIDPAKPYRYFLKNKPKKYIDLFFYDGSISKSVAFDNLLMDGNKFANRLQDGVSSKRSYDQLVNIATDGESYGHHTKFGDMALAYLLAIKAEDVGFELTNYGEFLERNKVADEVEIKPVSAWSCSHGVGRWMEDCGCSTGGHGGWNQKWRKPLREALDYLRDELAVLFDKEGLKYFVDPWEARNQYISVILDRSELSRKKYFSKVLKPDLDDEAKINALKLLEMQRQAMLMYTSCGWFFSEISGIETTQIMKYAARAMQLAEDFNLCKLESKFTKILEQAHSNIPEFQNGKVIYEKFVKPSVINIKQIASLWAFSSLFRDYDTETSLYCYDIKKINYKKISKDKGALLVGRIEIQSKITLEKSDMMFALLHHSGGDFHCTLKTFTDMSDYNSIQEKLTKTYTNHPVTEAIRQLDECFGKEYYTLRDIFIEERKKILDILLHDKLSKFASTYNELYVEGKSAIYHIQNLGLDIPHEFKIAAKYTLSRQFTDLILENENDIDDDILQQAEDIMNEAKGFGIELRKDSVNELFSRKITQRLHRLRQNLEIHQVEDTLELFNQVDRLELCIDISEAQNTYFTRIYTKVDEIIENIDSRDNIIQSRKFVSSVLELGQKLNINVDYYKNYIMKLTKATR